ncbi:MAG: hypothetical protein JSV92_03490 [archaeon]|nr:MAG: hypothetical protein JSV92_03490 [archaeon]
MEEYLKTSLERNGYFFVGKAELRPVQVALDDRNYKPEITQVVVNENGNAMAQINNCIYFGKIKKRGTCRKVLVYDDCYLYGDFYYDNLSMKNLFRGCLKDGGKISITSSLLKKCIKRGDEIITSRENPFPAGDFCTYLCKKIEKEDRESD